MELGSLGLKYLLENHATGYFPRRLVVPYLKDGTLKLIGQAPVFHYPAYVVYPVEGDPEVLALALKTMRRIAKAHARS